MSTRTASQSVMLVENIVSILTVAILEARARGAISHPAQVLPVLSGGELAEHVTSATSCVQNAMDKIHVLTVWVSK